MPKSSAKLKELRACTECRRRKSKCSGKPPCSFCSRANRPCIFGRAPSRTPLTRENLDRIERRCARLTALIGSLNPDIDIEDALSTTSTTPKVRHPREERSRRSPTSLDEFEWSETSQMSGTRKEPLDGMASLPTGNKEAGYLGTSAGSSILKTVPSLQVEQSSSMIKPQEHILSRNSFQTQDPLISVQLTDSVILNDLIDAYFTCYNTFYPVLHERIFQQKYQDRHQIPIQSSWHAIFYIVLAIGKWVRGGTSGSKLCIYHSAARSRMSIQMLESGTLLTVQAFLLMGNYLQKRDRPNTGYNYIGMAYRMALGLGLHREAPPGTKRDTLFQERRRVVWWVVYCFDSGFSITTGRPLMGSDCFIETRLPMNLDDSLCTLSSIIPPPIDNPTIYSAIIAHARLASIGNNIYSNVISAPKQDSLDLKTPRSLDHQLKAWKLSLPLYFTAQDIPDWFRGPRAVVIWKELNIRMMLWWGSQRLCKLASDVDDARDMCHYVAIEAIQEITTFCSDYSRIMHPGLSWYATYVLFQATIVLSAYYLKPFDESTSSHNVVNQELWILSISRARDCLFNLSKDNEAAARCLAVLDRIKDQSQQPVSTSSMEETTTNSTLDGTEVQPMSENIDMRPNSFEIDPALQILFQDTSWTSDIFEGLQGFPILDEPEVFDYMLPNGLPADTPPD